VLYEMLTGKSPYLAPTAQATIARILTHEPELITELNATVPPELERLVHLCLRKEAAQRPTSKLLTAELKKILATLSVREISGTQTRSASDLQGAAQAALLSTAHASAANAQAVTQTKIPSGVKPPSGITKPVAPEKLRSVYLSLKTLRILVSIATMVLPLAMFFYMVVGAGVIRNQIVEGTSIWSLTKTMVLPFLTFAENVFTFRPVVNGWNFMLLGLGAAALVARQIVLLPFDRAEHWARTRWVKATTKQQGKSMTTTAAPTAVADRLSLLRQYSEAQKTLSKGQRHLAFLSVDVVGSTAMKRNEDKLLIEHAFVEYRKFVERSLRAHNLWKVSSTPDGTMAAFYTEDDAVAAGKQILNELPWFNDGVHKLQTPFAVRCGVNAGEVIFPDDKTVDQVTDFVIDLAGHMQKYAAPNALWLAKEVLDGLQEKNGFRLVTTQEVDGRATYEWLPSVASAAKASNG
jgi:class 3 adenylate cyclase